MGSLLTTRVSGREFNLTPVGVEAAVSGVDPEPLREHYAVVGGRRYPPKQVLAEVTGLDRADFTTHQARSVLQRLGFGVYRRSQHPGRVSGSAGTPHARGPHGGAEAALLADHRGRWVAQDDLEILFDADSPDAVVQWMRRHGRKARVWRVPASPADIGSVLTSDLTETRPASG